MGLIDGPADCPTGFGVVVDRMCGGEACLLVVGLGPLGCPGELLFEVEFVFRFGFGDAPSPDLISVFV